MRLDKGLVRIPEIVCNQGKRLPFNNKSAMKNIRQFHLPILFESQRTVLARQNYMKNHSFPSM
jgi:hypothetical protein